MGGYGCGSEQPNESPYMKELIVRWYQFGCFCPIFRTHGHRKGQAEKLTGKCGPAPGHPWTESGGPNEAWSYGADTQVHLEKYIRLRATLKPYIAELAANVTATGVPTMRPLYAALLRLWYSPVCDRVTQTALKTLQVVRVPR
eukprot:SAG31_NODE_574_length_13967_cov_7.512042_8_plen_143_part_00